jgi:hypothetical protein
MSPFAQILTLARAISFFDHCRAEPDIPKYARGSRQLLTVAEPGRVPEGGTGV